jgi:hypothetical protein
MEHQCDLGRGVWVAMGLDFDKKIPNGSAQNFYEAG